MAKIPIYNAETQAGGNIEGRKLLAPDQSGLETFAKGLNDVGNAVQKYQDHEQISDAAKDISQLRVDWTNYTQELKKTGDVPESYVTDLHNHLSQLKDKYANNPAAKDYVEQHSNQIIQDYAGLGTHIESQIAGEKELTNYTILTNNVANDARSSPTTWKTGLSLINERIDQNVKAGNGLSFEQGEVLKRKSMTETAEAAAQGYIDANPHDGKMRILSGEFDSYLDPKQKESMIRFADTTMRADRVQSDYDRARGKEALKDAQDKQMGEYMKKLYGDGLDTRTVINDKMLTTLQKENVLNMIHKTATNAARNDPSVSNDIYKEINKQDSTIFSPDQIIEKVGHGIDGKTAQWLTKVLADRKSPNGMKESAAQNLVMKEASKKLLGDPTLGPNPEGQNRLNAFTQNFYNEWTEQRKNGATAQELSDPKSPKYLGKLIDQYQMNFKEVLDAKMKTMSMKQQPKGAAPTNKMPTDDEIRKMTPAERKAFRESIGG
jgi:hypothetical protein